MCAAAGVVSLLVATNRIEVEKYAPAWIIYLVAAIFLIFSFWLVMVAFGREQPWVGPLLLVLFLILANWVAFGPGPRHGRTTLSLPLISLSGDSKGIGARIVPAIGAIILDGIVLYGIYRAVRARTR